MFQKRELTVNTTENGLRDRLRIECNRKAPIGWVKENTFCLFKRFGAEEGFAVARFSIKGEFEKAETGTRMTYRVVPDLGTFVILAVVALMLVYGIAGVFAGDGWSALGLGALCNAVMWGYTVYGSRDVGDRLEERLTAKQP